MFSVGLDVVMTVAGTDNGLVLVKNPPGNVYNLHIRSVLVGIDVVNVTAKFKLLANPTISANGTARTPVNATIGNSVASTATVFTLPTTTLGSSMLAVANGQNSGGLLISISGYIVILPGNSLLITGDPASNNRAATVTIMWDECKQSSDT